MSQSIRKNWQLSAPDVGPVKDCSDCNQGRTCDCEPASGVLLGITVLVVVVMGLATYGVVQLVGRVLS